MRKWKHSAVAGAVICLSLIQPVSAETLNEAIHHTIITNPVVQGAAKARLAADQTWRGAMGGYFPTIDVNWGYGKENSNNSTTRTTGLHSFTRRELGVQLRQMVFDGFATPSEVRRTKMRANAQSCTVAAEANDSALRVAEAYYNILRQQVLVRDAKSNKARHHGIVDMIDKRVTSGITKKAELVESQGRTALADANYLTELNNLNQAKVAYLREVGRMPGRLTAPHVNTHLLPRSREAAIEFAVQHHPRLISANYDIKEAQAQHVTANSPFFPRLDIVLGANHNHNIDGVAGLNDDVSAMLEANWKIFNGFKDLARSRETMFLSEQATEIRNRTYRQTVESTGLSWLAMTANKALMVEYDRHQKASRATADAFGDQFKKGQRTLLDLLDQENEYFSAQRAYTNAKYDYLFAQLRIFNSMGILLHALGLTPPTEANVCMLPTTGDIHPSAKRVVLIDPHHRHAEVRFVKRTTTKAKKHTSHSKPAPVVKQKTKEVAKPKISSKQLDSNQSKQQQSQAGGSNSKQQGQHGQAAPSASHQEHAALKTHFQSPLTSGKSTKPKWGVA